jgi:uncharacterized protein (TIGR03437 family)
VGTASWNGDYPTKLNDTSMTVNNKPAFLWFVSPGQINAMAPNDTATGTVPVTVTNANGSTTTTVTLAAASPSFLLAPDAKQVSGIIVTPNGKGSQGGGTYDLLGSTSLGPGYRPAKAGEDVAIYGVGGGPTTPVVPAGQPYICPAAGCATMVTLPTIAQRGLGASVPYGRPANPNQRSVSGAIAFTTAEFGRCGG